MKNKQPKLYVIAAPSGAGKTSLVHEILKFFPQISLSISYTTRPQRPGEQAHADYHFVSSQVFNQMISNNDFLEYAKVYDYYYGTSKRFIETQLAAGQDVILEIDWQGARQIKKQFVDCILIFILPPSLHALSNRLRQRAQDDEIVIAKRMQAAKNEIKHYQDFDYIVVNDDFNVALAAIKAIIKNKPPINNKQEYARLIAELLK